MKTLLKNEQGAVLIIELVVLAVVLAAAGLAAYQYASHKNAANQATKPMPHVVAKASPTPTPTPAANIFSVKELGIQFTVTSDIRDLVYQARTSNGIIGAYFSSLSLEAADKNAGGNQCTLTNSPVGAIDLRAFTPDGDVAIKKIGNQYLNYTHPQWMCSTNSSVMNLANQQIASFLKALQTATTTPTPVLQSRFVI